MSDPQMGAFFGCSYFSVLARRAFFGRFIEFWRKKQFILYSYDDMREGMDFLVQEGQEVFIISGDFLTRARV